MRLIEKIAESSVQLNPSHSTVTATTKVEKLPRSAFRVKTIALFTGHSVSLCHDFR